MKTPSATMSKEKNMTLLVSVYPQLLLIAWMWSVSSSVIVKLMIAELLNRPVVSLSYALFSFA